MSGNISVIIHGHFYQPPRENPWTQKIPLQENARPHHDWNERITAECYNPNTRSRVIDPQGKIVSVVNNFAHFNFNIGPTLFSWLEQHHPDTYRRILEADRRSVEQFNGHGNAIAQVYNHIILPLANRRDKLTQIRWGIREFQHRFKRKPEAIWLAETAINQETIECLIDEGMNYVILAPTQAQRVRRMDEQGGWRDVSQNSIDTRQPYRLFSHQIDAPSRRDALRRESASFQRPVRRLELFARFRERLSLPLKKRVRQRWQNLACLRQRQPVAQRKKARRQYIDAFFYDGALAAEVSFQHLLQNAKNFAQRVRNAAGHGWNAPPLVHFATDGEVYGHHEAFADMCVAHAVLHEFPSLGIELTNYGQFLAQYPPTMEVELKRGGQADEGTAWSCSHGVGRWYRSCGCQIGNMPGWTQQWRTPLRNGLDRLRDTLAEMFESYLARLLRDPWKARDNYIECLLTPSSRTVDSFLARYQTHPLSDEAQSLVLRCMEAQKYMMFAYTSCAWFFDDLSGIEVRQNLRYAARAIQLMDDLFPYFAAHHPDPARRGLLKNKRLEDFLTDELLHARSNVPGVGNGKDVYWKYIKPEIFTPEHAANHFLLEQLLERVYQTASTLHRPDEMLNDGQHERQVYLYQVRCQQSLLADNCQLPFARNAAPQSLPHHLTQTDHHAQQHTVCSGMVEVCDTTTRQRWTMLSIGFMRQSDQPISYLKRMETPSDWEHFKAFLLPYFSQQGVDGLDRFEQALQAQGFTRYGFHDLYWEDRERFFYQMVQHGVHRLEAHLHAIYEDSRRFLAGLTALHVGIPEELRQPIEFALSYRLRRETEKLSNTQDGLSPTRLSAELEELLRLSATHHITLDKTLLQRRLSEALDAYVSSLGTQIHSCASSPHLLENSAACDQSIDCIQETIGLLAKSREFGLSLNTTEAQNRTFEIFQENLLPFLSSYYKQGGRIFRRYPELISAYLSLLDQLNFNTGEYKARLKSSQP